MHDDGEIWWKFHPILASYLAQSCRLELPCEWQELHKIAAMMWLKLGYGSEALYHAQMLEDSQTLYTIYKNMVGRYFIKVSLSYWKTVWHYFQRSNFGKTQT
ncbi:ATP-dependent transcriptional regulator [Actinobacillus pleuropneumoniae]|nr:ATP-dependent transcriptional regulator [Actinobacillus pleuropneumoniae]